MGFNITGDPAADAVLDDPFALLTAMLLDQQVPMERAFAGPAKILDRFGTLDPAVIAAAPPAKFADVCATAPAVHRFPGSMADRIQQLARQITEVYGGDAATLWQTADSGDELVSRLQALPGFGPQKAQIFAALLGKQLGVRPPGRRKAAGNFAEDGAYRSVADVRDQSSLDKVRAHKVAMKAKAAADKA